MNYTLIITNNKNSARPAGKVITYNGQLYRFAQDGVPLYGSKVRAYKITTLTTEKYEEQEIKERNEKNNQRGTSPANFIVEKLTGEGKCEHYNLILMQC